MKNVVCFALALTFIASEAVAGSPDPSITNARGAMAKAPRSDLLNCFIAAGGRAALHNAHCTGRPKMTDGDAAAIYVGLSPMEQVAADVAAEESQLRSVNTRSPRVLPRRAAGASERSSSAPKRLLREHRE
jgi:hypothetical protein